MNIIPSPEGCPFCGSPCKVVGKRPLNHVSVFYVTCDGCGAGGPQSENEREAVMRPQSAEMTPIIFKWTLIDTVRPDGELAERLVMVPLDKIERLCIKQFAVDEQYRMEVIEERSAASHKQYFAAIREAWKQLPENIAANYTTPEALRKRALIKCGYTHEQSIVFDTAKQAERAAAFMKPLFDFDVVVVQGNVLKHYRALSQSYSEMDKEMFQVSKARVLALLDDLIGTPKGTLKREAGKSA